MTLAFHPRMPRSGLTQRARFSSPRRKTFGNATIVAEMVISQKDQWIPDHPEIVFPRCGS